MLVKRYKETGFQTRVIYFKFNRMKYSFAYTSEYENNL